MFPFLYRISPISGIHEVCLITESRSAIRNPPDSCVPGVDSCINGVLTIIPMLIQLHLF